jgi:putative sporulation protein YyaC
MERIKFDYKKRENYTEMVNKLKEIITKDTLICCIGTDRCIGDLIGGLVGTILQENNFPLKVFGTVEFPMHALNLEKRFAEIKELYPTHQIIAIDACLGDKEDIGQIQYRDIPIHPGKGVGKSLPKVGDYSLIGIVDSSDDCELFTNRSIRLDLVYGMSKVISEALFEAVTVLHKKRGRKKKIDIKLFNNRIAS